MGFIGDLFRLAKKILLAVWKVLKTIFKILSITVNTVIYTAYLIYLIYAIIAGVGVLWINIVLAAMTVAYMIVFFVFRLSKKKAKRKVKYLKQTFKIFKIVAKIATALTAIYALITAINNLSPLAIFFAALGVEILFIRLVIGLAFHIIGRIIDLITDGVTGSIKKRFTKEADTNEEPEDTPLPSKKNKSKKGGVLWDENGDILMPEDEYEISDAETQNQNI